MKIILNTNEMRIAAYTAVERCIQSIGLGLKDAHGYKGEDSWDININGSGAEMAVAKFLNKYWGAPVGNFKGADIGENIQVRSSINLTAKMVIRKNDNLNDYYVFSIGKIPNYEIIGFIKGVDARREEWYTDNGNGRPPAWFVPQSALKKFKNESTSK